MKLYAVLFIVFSQLPFGVLSTAQAQEPIASEAPAVSEVQPLFNVKMDKHIERSKITYLITITANAEDIAIGTTAVVAHVKDSAGGSKLHALKPNVNAQGQKMPVWALTVVPEKSARYVINLRVNSKNAKGKRISETLPAQYFTYPSPDDPIVYPENDELTLLRKEVAKEVADVPRENSGKASYGGPKEHEDDSIIDVSMTDEIEEDNASMSWPVMGAVAAAGVVLLVLLFFLYRRFTAKRKERSGDEGENENGDNEVESQDGGTAPSGKGNEKEKSVENEESQGDSIDIGDEDPLSELDAAFNMETEPTEDAEEVEDVDIEADEVETLEVEEVEELEVENIEVEGSIEIEETGSEERAIEPGAESAVKKENDT